jgi:uncharacterized membrane-anchored protein YitT (DUF2179 family)
MNEINKRFCGIMTIKKFTTLNAIIASVILIVMAWMQSNTSEAEISPLYHIVMYGLLVIQAVIAVVLFFAYRKRMQKEPDQGRGFCKR